MVYSSWHLLGLNIQHHFLVLLGSGERLIEGQWLRGDGDGEHGIVSLPQLAAVLEGLVRHIVVGNAVVEGVVGHKHVLPTRQAHLLGFQKERGLMFPTNQHRVHTHDDDWKTRKTLSYMQNCIENDNLPNPVYVKIASGFFKR